ncbi:MAG: type I restriction enzyme HsdR N-terminal domain-containing protein [Flavobacteriaceae bacterium]
MIKLNFPEFEFKLKKIESKTFIFDFVRKRYFLLTPEEWVRQHVLHFLVSNKIPKTHIAVEKKITINDLNKRFDVVVFDRNYNPLMIIECKSPSVKINQEAFDQISIYNLKIRSKFLMITNGLNNLYFKIDEKNKSHIFVKEFPLL